MPLRSAYNHLLVSRSITPDPAQEGVIERLSNLHAALEAYERGKKKLLAFNKPPLPKGVYIYGEVGRGKSMVMDLFFTAVTIKKKRRVHFHAFMLEVHARLHAWRQQHKHSNQKDNDPIPPIAKSIAHHCQLLCFDELQVTDIADAMILGRLFNELFRQQVVVVATSNRPPSDLYKDGLQRERFLEFIDILVAHVDVVELCAAQDYRLAQLQSLHTLYYTPLGPEADAFIRESFASLTQHAHPTLLTLSVQGRVLPVREAVENIALFSFAELCETPLGAADYIALSERFATIIIQNIPKLTPEKRNEAKRFVTLIDALYEHQVTLLCSAEVPAQELYTEGSGAFEFQRTVSRLIEMQSARYIALPHCAAHIAT